MADGYLPPDPGGPEPELGAGAGRPHPPAQQAQTWGGGQQSGWAPPQHAWGGQHQPHPAWSPPGQGWGQPHPAWGEPDNAPAVAGFSLSIASIGLWVVSGTLFSVFSLGLAIAGIVQARKGKRRIARGETRKHGDLATAGIVIGWIATVLSALGSLLWVGIVIFAAVEAGTNHGFDDGLDGDGDPALLHLVTVLRLTGLALA